MAGVGQKYGITGSQDGGWTFTGTLAGVTGAFSGVLSLANGTAAAPAAAFTSDTDTGFFRTSANVLGVAAGGSSVGTFSSAGFTGATVGAHDGTVGATTPAAGSFTTVAASSTLTVSGTAFHRGKSTLAQAAPAAKTVTAGITAAELVAGLITTTGATAPSIHQLPTGTEIDAALTGVATGDSFDFYLINTGTGASDDATITVNTDVTIVGNPTVGALTDATIISGSGHFRARRSAANTYVVYRLS